MTRVAKEKLSEGMKVALSMAAHEVFVEHVDLAVDDARELIERNDFGGSWQGYDKPLTDEEIAQHVTDLAPWLTADVVVRAIERTTDQPAHALSVELLDKMIERAGIDLAEGIVWLALKHPKKLSPKARPFVRHLEPFAKRLAKKIEEGDASEWDATDAIFG